MLLNSESLESGTPRLWTVSVTVAAVVLVGVVAAVFLVPRAVAEERPKVAKTSPSDVKKDESTVAVPEATAGDTVESRRKLVEKVIAGITANYAKFASIDAIVEEILLDSTVEKEETETVTTPDGAILTTTISPKTTLEWRFYLDGAKIRSDRVEPGLEKRPKGPCFSVMECGLSTKREIKTAWLRRPDQMPGMNPVNIRDIRAIGLTETVVAVLQKDEIVTRTWSTHHKAQTSSRLLLRVAAVKQSGYSIQDMDTCQRVGVQSMIVEAF